MIPHLLKQEPGAVTTEKARRSYNMVYSVSPWLRSVSMRFESKARGLKYHRLREGCFDSAQGQDICTPFQQEDYCDQ